MSHNPKMTLDLFFPIFLFKRTPEIEEIVNALEKEEDALSNGRIRCPLCQWRPTRESRWVCADAPENRFDGCGTWWNTFETRGLCPGCSHQWIWTTCLRCHRSSPHEDWYE